MVYAEDLRQDCVGYQPSCVTFMLLFIIRWIIKVVSGFKNRLTCNSCEDSQQEHLVPHLLFLFLVGQLLLCTFGAGDAEFPDGCHSDKLPASFSHGEQQPCTASSQWAAYFGQVSRNDRSVDGTVLKEWLDLWVGGITLKQKNFSDTLLYAFITDSGPNSWLSRRCFWERPHELQWRPGPDDPAADQCSRAEAGGDVCAVVPAWTSAAPGCESWEGQGEFS